MNNLNVAGKASQKTIDWVIKEHNRIVDEEIEKFLRSADLKMSEVNTPLTVGTVEKWCRLDQEKLKEMKHTYIEKLEELEELILALNNENLVLSTGIRLQCLEHLLTLISTIIWDLEKILLMTS